MNLIEKAEVLMKRIFPYFIIFFGALITGYAFHLYLGWLTGLVTGLIYFTVLTSIYLFTSESREQKWRRGVLNNYGEGGQE